MKQKILVTRQLSPDLIDKLNRYFDVEVNAGKKYSTTELIQAVQGKQGILLAGGEKIDALAAEQLHGIKAICISAAGYNNVDVDALTQSGIIVTNAPGPADETVADFAWGAMIMLARKAPEAERWLRQGNWTSSAGSRFFGTDVYGKTLGIIGMGRIGQAIARRAVGFNMPVFYYNRNRLTEDIESVCRATYLSKPELLVASDFVLLALPYAKANHHLIGKDELSQMKPSAMLINIARGGLIDEAALADALIQHKLAGAALDVFEEEPVVYPALLDLPNVLLTPHIAGATEKAQHGIAAVAVENLVAALGYGPDAYRPVAILNPAVLAGHHS